MFYLARYYQYMIYLSVLVPVIYAGSMVLRHGRQIFAGLQAGDLLAIGRKRWLHLVILLVFVANCFLVPLHMDQSASAEISLNYAKASQGLNPNGTRYNQADILSTEVLENAIQKGALENVTAGELRNALSVGPLVQGGSDSEASYFISTQFGLYFGKNPNVAHLDGPTVLGLVAESYKTWFMDQYSENTCVLEIDFTDFAQKDYLDICKYLRRKAESVGSYMQKMSNEEAAFQSVNSKETFQSISSQAYAVGNTMVERLEAYLLESGISKAATEYQGRLGFQNVFYHFDALKAAAAHVNNLAAISMYEDDMARIVLVPTYDPQDQFYMSQTRIGIDDFAAEADSYADTKTEIRSKIAANEHVRQMLSGPSVPNGTDEKAEQLIGQIENELNRLAQEAKTLVQEYNTRQANQYMTITVMTMETQWISVVLRIFLYTLLPAGGVFLCALSADMNRKNRKRKWESRRRRWVPYEKV